MWVVERGVCDENTHRVGLGRRTHPSRLLATAELTMSSTSALPLLLPPQHTKTNSYPEWKPSRHLQPPQAPVVDDQRVQDLELAVQRQLLDGKALKKTRPRRTVDYAGGMGRWALVCCITSTRLFGSFVSRQFRKLQPNPRYVPYIRPSPPYIIDVRVISIY